MLPLAVEAMRRRDVLKFIGAGTAVWPVAGHAQQPDRMRLVGVLIGWSEGDPATQSLVAAFRETLAKLGWTEGRDVRLEVRWGNGDAARIGAYAKELVSQRPDVILGQT